MPAIMIPTEPRMYDKNSHEDFIFERLKELPSDYYVIHSFCSTDIIDNIFVEKEADFVIFHPKKGILVLEAKAGGVEIENDAWIYKTSKKRCNYDGPYRQADLAMRFIMRQVESKMKGILSKCKFLYTACFPDMREKEINNIQFRTQEEKFKNRTISRDDLLNKDKLLEKIEEIFKLDTSNERIKTNLTEKDTQQIINIFCRNIHVSPSADLSHDITQLRFFNLLQEQLNVLHFLQEQKTVAINGAAGTGKTVIACERAKQLVEDEGEKVLYLCFNAFLCNFLKEQYKQYEGKIDFYTISSYACKIAESPLNGAVYTKAKNNLSKNSELLTYNHIIIDEAQDFGIKIIEDSGLIEEIFYIILYEREKGSFFCFYDQLQMIYNKTLPKFITEADCKITLFKNCRNTSYIARTSLKPIVTEKNKRRLDNLDKVNHGKTPRIFFTEQKRTEECLDFIIDDLQSNRGLKPKDIVILTLGIESESIIPNSNGKYKNRYVFTTAKKFKGLESRGIILVDVTSSSFLKNSKQIEEQQETEFDINDERTYYVGASRAREFLEIITSMTDNECLTVLKENENFEVYEDLPLKKAKKEFVNVLGANKKEY